MSRCSCSAYGSFLIAKGLEEAEQRGSSLELAGAVAACYLDKVRSVSALAEAEDPWVESIIEEQYQRFLNGS